MNEEDKIEVCGSYFTKEEYNKLADGRTDLEIEQEKTIQKLIEENKKLEIENNLMRELLSRPVSYTYGIR